MRPTRHSLSLAPCIHNNTDAQNCTIGPSEGSLLASPAPAAHESSDSVGAGILSSLRTFSTLQPPKGAKERTLNQIRYAVKP